ncbi:hypothetical protein ACVWYH_005222 [Bradyrhizobium sp. GM24.11]
MFSGHVLERSGNWIGPRQETVDFAVWVTIDDLCDDVGEVGVWFDIDELAGLDQRGDDGPMLAAAVGAREECVFAVQRNYPSILPMSGRMLKSFIAGMRFMDAVFD